MAWFADIAAFTVISAVSRHLPWNQLTRLAAWRDRIGRRPAVQTGMTAFDDKRETVNQAKAVAGRRNKQRTTSQGA
jgi:glutathione S-transferase